MSITAIIANRNELPQNLQRTLASIQGQGVKVDVVNDAPEVMGCGYRRHQGILRAATDKVFLCDGHMEFSPGYFEGLSRQLDTYPDDVLCTRMVSISHDWEPLGAPYHGGVLHWQKEQAPGEFMPFTAKWHKGERADGVIGAPLGACYAMTRDTYLRMGSPLAILRAWGGDEELLGLAAWMTGGAVRLVPGTAYHMYAAPRIGGRAADAGEVVRIWGNYEAILRAVPMSPTDLAASHKYMMEGAAARMHRRGAIASADTRMQDIVILRRALMTGGRDFKWLKDNVLGKESINMAKKPSKPTKRAAKKAVKPMSKRSETTPTPKAPQPQSPRANYTANENNRTCQKCGSSDSKVDSLRRHVRMVVRYRICLNCGARRVTQDFFAAE